MTKPNKNTERTWLDLDVEELEQVMATGQLPPNVGWGTLPQHPDFAKIFRVRENPARIAKILLDNIAKTNTQPAPPKTSRHQYIPALSQEYREQRLLLKREELALARDKQKNQTVMFEKICQLETDVHTLKKLLRTVIDLLREREAHSRAEARAADRR